MSLSRSFFITNTFMYQRDELQDAVMQAITNVVDSKPKYVQFDEKIVRQLVKSIRVVSEDIVIITFKTGEEIRQRISI